MDIKKEISKREYVIDMYGYDARGSSAWSNVDKIRELREEIANLRKYGVAKPSLFRRLIRRTLSKEY